MLFGVAAHDPAVEVAANEIADHDDAVEGQDAAEVGAPVIQRGAGIEIRISNAVREAAHNEERHAEEHGHVVALAGEGDGGGHDEAAADAEKSAAECTCTQAKFQYVLCCCLDLHRSDTGKKRCAETSYDVS